MPHPFVSFAMRPVLFSTLFLLLAMPDARAGSGIEISDAWARATVPGQQVASVYLQIRSATPARVIRVTSPGAKAAEIHSMTEQGGVMKMRRLDGLDLPAGQTVKLAPGGNHIMLLDIRKPLQPGERVRLTLVVQQKGKTTKIPVDAEVREIGAAEK